MKKHMSIILTTFLFLLSHGAHSYPQSTDFQSVSQLYIDIDDDGIKEDVKLLQGKTDRDEQGYIMGISYYIQSNLSSGGIVSNDVKQIWVEGRRRIYLMEIKPSENLPSMVGVTYSSGMHGGNLDIYTVKNKELVKINDIFCDGAYVEMIDKDNDGIKEIVAYSRDYDNDPVQDEKSKIYKYANGQWELLSR